MNKPRNLRQNTPKEERILQIGRVVICKGENEQLYWSPDMFTHNGLPYTRSLNELAERIVYDRKVAKELGDNRESVYNNYSGIIFGERSQGMTGNNLTVVDSLNREELEYLAKKIREIREAKDVKTASFEKALCD